MPSSPAEIRLRRKSGVLTLVYANGTSYDLSAEFLRVHSPSAEVRGHGKGQGILQTGKRNVALIGVEPVGSYAIKLVFDDRHDSGIYSWDYLYQLCTQYDTMWQSYLQSLKDAGASRDPVPSGQSLSEAVQVIKIQPLSPPQT
ncbi:MAG: DUF971 domain-containing protein [Gammaproteobacteria bacterium]|nr:DUF971 domain-containing protein [Gammaproteobacteria bacterium]MDP2139898.1 DUF971 domain-containing protein [Gammaproteobacteria bacterium]MDP2347718.1 DUF971 domain-containing protein [Gammaproteobacteria bacterium]